MNRLRTDSGTVQGSESPRENLAAEPPVAAVASGVSFEEWLAALAVGGVGSCRVARARRGLRVAWIAFGGGSLPARVGRSVAPRPALREGSALGTCASLPFDRPVEEISESLGPFSERASFSLATAPPLAPLERTQECVDDDLHFAVREAALPIRELHLRKIGDVILERERVDPFDVLHGGLAHPDLFCPGQRRGRRARVSLLIGQQGLRGLTLGNHGRRRCTFNGRWGLGRGQQAFAERFLRVVAD